MKIETLKKFRNQMLTVDALCAAAGLDRNWTEDTEDAPCLLIEMNSGVVRVRWVGNSAFVSAKASDGTTMHLEEATNLHMICYSIGRAVEWVNSWMMTPADGPVQRTHAPI